MIVQKQNNATVETLESELDSLFAKGTIYEVSQTDQVVIYPNPSNDIVNIAA